MVLAQEAPEAQSQEMATTEEAPKIPNDQLDSLVAPIALYPDAMLAQTLAASTYPLEVMQLDQWMDKNKNLKDKALADAVAKQPWDPSVQSMAAFPEVVQRMAENIQWMTDVGNAFLAQQKDVMDAVQRMRAKAQGTGNLKTGSEQKVETKTTQSGQQVIVVEQANPEAPYVPSYDPAVVYGAAPAESPYYPYSYPGYQPGTALAWGSAIAVGGIWANNNWGNYDWDDGNVTINNNNNFNKNYNKNVNKTGAGQGNSWQHNPQHRGNAPYANKQTANRYGGKTAGGAGKPGGAGGVGGAGKPPRRPRRCRWRWWCRKTWRPRRCGWRWKTWRCRKTWRTRRCRWRWRCWKTWRCRRRWQGNKRGWRQGQWWQCCEGKWRWRKRRRRQGRWP